MKNGTCLVVAVLAHHVSEKGGWRLDGKLGSRWAGWSVQQLHFLLFGGLLLGADPITPFCVEIGILK